MLIKHQLHYQEKTEQNVEKCILFDFYKKDTLRAIFYLIFFGMLITTFSIDLSQTFATGIPSWINQLIAWNNENKISEEEFVAALEYLSKNNIFPFNEKEIRKTQTISTSVGVINFYVNDNDLNTSPNGVDIISTKGLIEATINGQNISIPQEMIETSSNSGRFVLKITIPEKIKDIPLNQNDVIIIRYIDQSDSSGEKRVVVKSIPIVKTFAKIQTSDEATRIGQEFTLRIYEPDANRDSDDEDKISLNLLEFRAEGGIRTTLSNPAFSANSAFLIETGPNSNIFEVNIEIPRNINGKIIHIGDGYEIRYIDTTTPSDTNEKIILKGRIG